MKTQLGVLSNWRVRRGIGIAALPLVIFYFWTAINSHNQSCPADAQLSPEQLGICSGGHTGILIGMAFWSIILIALIRLPKEQRQKYTLVRKMLTAVMWVGIVILLMFLSSFIAYYAS